MDSSDYFKNHLSLIDIKINYFLFSLIIVTGLHTFLRLDSWYSFIDFFGISEFAYSDIDP